MLAAAYCGRLGPGARLEFHVGWSAGLGHPPWKGGGRQAERGFSRVPSAKGIHRLGSWSASPTRRAGKQRKGDGQLTRRSSRPIEPQPQTSATP